MTPEKIQDAIINAGKVSDAASRLAGALHALSVAMVNDPDARRNAEKAHRALLSAVADVNGSLMFL